MYLSLQARLPEFLIPHVGDPPAGGRDRLAGSRRYRLHPGKAGVTAAARKVLPQENPVQESIHTTGELRDHHSQDGGEVGQGD